MTPEDHFVISEPGRGSRDQTLESSLGLSPWGQRDPGDEGGIGQSTQCQREATGLFKPCKNSIPQFWSPWLRCKQRKQMLLKYLWPASTPFDSRVSPVASSLLLSEANAITRIARATAAKIESNRLQIHVHSGRPFSSLPRVPTDDLTHCSGHINLNCPWRTAMCTCSRKDHCRVTNQFPWLPANCLSVSVSPFLIDLQSGTAVIRELFHNPFTQGGTTISPYSSHSSGS